MNLPITSVDVLLLLVLLVGVPALVTAYLKKSGAPKSLINKVIILGMCWVVFGLVSEDLLDAMAIMHRGDSRTHELTAVALVQGTAPDFFDEFPTGNKAYQTFVYGLFLMGAYVPGVRAVNAFWASGGAWFWPRYLVTFVAFERGDP